LWSRPVLEPVPERWDGPYVTKTIAFDPWGNPYEYRVPGPGGLPFGIRSYGADGRPGGDDDAEDIVSWSH
jgi:general secretion pathway protein G